MEKVLLILESEDMQARLKEALANYQVEACTAQEAAEALTRLQPDALVLDLFLPGTDGLTVLENCRELLPPVVLPLSILITEYIQMKAAQLGAGFVIPKPCTIEYIVTRLTDMLLLQRFPDLSDDGAIVDTLLAQFRLRGKPRVLAILRTAILMAFRDPDHMLTKDIYPVLAKAYDGNADAVDQAIRRMLRSSWAHRKETAAIWELVFPGCTKCPSNGEFITTVALYLRKKYPSHFRKGS